MSERDMNTLRMVINRLEALYQRRDWPSTVNEHLDEALRRLSRAEAELQGRNQ